MAKKKNKSAVKRLPTSSRTKKAKGAEQGSAGLDLRALADSALAAHQAGDMAAAEDGYQELLRHEPHNCDINYLFACLLIDTGRKVPGVALLKKTMLLHPADVKASYKLGVVHQLDGELEPAKGFFLKATKLAPHEPVIFNSYAIVLQALGENLLAEESYGKAIELKEDYLEARNNIGFLLNSLGRAEEAEAHIRRALELEPNYMQALNNMASVQFNLGNIIPAEEYAGRALAINARLPHSLYVMGRIHAGRDEQAQARHHFLQTLEAEPAFSEAHNSLASLLREDGDMEGALKHAQAAVAATPDAARFHTNLALLLKDLGRLDEAIEHNREALKIRPEFASAHYNLAQLKQHSEIDEELLAMKELYDRGVLSVDEHCMLCFGLGKAFDELGQSEEAFEYLSEANRLKRETLEFNSMDFFNGFERVKQVFGSEFVQRTQSGGIGDDTPIFVLGMPRSGSSLLEQVLASHSQVHGAGELNYIRKMYSDNDTNANSYFGARFPDSAAQLSCEELRENAGFYLEKLRKHSASDTRIVDKMPHNFIYLPLIVAMFPKATIIHCRRHPLDNCLSIFQTAFAAEGHLYAYDLKELGNYYRGYYELMQHWQRLYSSIIHTIDYEDMVAAPEQTTRELLQKCQLPFESTCLEFHNNKRPVFTASAAQVRRPLYKSSVERWRPYEKHLQPLIKALRLDLMGIEI